MEPAASIIKSLGGGAEVGRALNINRSWVAKWPKPQAEGGRDGRIPEKYVPALIAFAQVKGIELKPGDFFPAVVVAESTRDAELTRTLRALLDAGIKIGQAEIDPTTGKITLVAA